MLTLRILMVPFWLPCGASLVQLRFLVYVRTLRIFPVRFPYGSLMVFLLVPLRRCTPCESSWFLDAFLMFALFLAHVRLCASLWFPHGFIMAPD